eukprot:266017_1
MSFAPDKNTIEKQGWLEKKSKYLGVWRSRWFILTREYLFIYTEKNTKENAKTIIQLCTISVTTFSDTIFKVEGDENYLLKASTGNEKQQWIDAIDKYTKECVKLPIIVQCQRDEDFNDNFELVVPYNTKYPYSINALITDIIDYKQKKHSPFKFIAFKIKSNSFIGQEIIYDDYDWNNTNTYITDYDKSFIQQTGMHLQIDIAIYQHNISSLGVLCENMKNKNELCPIYEAMRYHYDFSEKYLNHLYEYMHPDLAECRHGDECHSYKRLEKGGNRLTDRCHIAIFKHPRRRQKRLPIGVGTFCWNEIFAEHMPLYKVNHADKKKCNDNKQDGYLQFLLQEVINNGYKSDLCLNEENKKNDGCTLMTIVEQKLKLKRHKLMGSPLNKAEMLSLLLYTSCNSCYDLCKSQRDGDYKKW